MSRATRTVVVHGQEKHVSLRMLLDAVDLIAAEAPNTANIKIRSDSPDDLGVLGGFFQATFATGDDAPKWLVGARWDETVGEEKTAEKSAPAAAAAEAAS